MIDTTVILRVDEDERCNQKYTANQQDEGGPLHAAAASVDQSGQQRGQIGAEQRRAADVDAASLCCLRLGQQ